MKHERKHLELDDIRRLAKQAEELTDDFANMRLTNQDSYNTAVAFIAGREGLPSWMAEQIADLRKRDDEMRYRVWKLYDGSGEYEVLDFSRQEPSTVFIGSEKDARHKAAYLNAHPGSTV